MADRNKQFSAKFPPAVAILRLKRALARGDDLEEVIRRIADFRSSDKSDPVYYARLTVTKAQAELQRESSQRNTMDQEPVKSDDRSHSDLNPIT